MYNCQLRKYLAWAIAGRNRFYAGLLLITMSVIACQNAGTGQAEKATDAAMQDTAMHESPEPATTKQTLTDTELSFGAIRFRVYSSEKDGQNYFTIVPTGYLSSNDSMTQAYRGVWKEVIIDDIDGDNQPELAVITSEGPAAYGHAYLFSSNNNRSMSPAHLPELDIRQNTLKGYKGGDEYNFVENTFIRRFPVYNADTVFGTRQLQYKLKKGEAMKQLVLDRVVNY